LGFLEGDFSGGRHFTAQKQQILRENWEQYAVKLDNYMFRPYWPSSGCLQENLRSYYIHCAHTWCRDLYIRALLRNVISISGGMLWLARAYHQRCCLQATSLVLLPQSVNTV